MMIRTILLSALTFTLAAPALALDAPVEPARAIQVVQAAAVSGDTAQAMIENLGTKAMNAIADTASTPEQKKATFKNLLSQNFDLATIGRFALGTYWRQATPAQQQEYLKLYETMIINVYSARFDNYAGQQFTVRSNRVDDSGDVVVTSAVSGNGPEVNVDWRVRNKGQGPKIIDVMVEGVSMAVTQRNDFASVISQGGGNVDALLDYLRKGGTSDVKE